MASLVAGLGPGLGCSAALAQDSAPEVHPPAEQNAHAIQPPSAELPIRALGDAYQNSIKLLKNRFRVDPDVDELTLIFFREYGSAPVVLVQPDGSKLFQGREDQPQVEWFDEASFDMVKISQPTPGPWQAVGQLLPGSRIMVVSDIALDAQPLPEMVFAGEILKQTATLENGGKAVSHPEFRDAVDLTIELVSTNNADYDNFGADSEIVATFKDDGLGMDEQRMDGIFTGQFNLTVPAGQWTPIFRVTTPMFTREQIDPPIILHPNPVSLSVSRASEEEQYHTLQIDVDRNLVAIESLIVDGKVRYPNGDIQNFSLTEPSDAVRTHDILTMEEGLFRVKLTVYATTLTGREFILDIPEYTFDGRPPPPVVAEGASQEEPGAMDAGQASEMQASEMNVQNAPQSEPVTEPAAPPAEPEMAQSTFILLLALVNGGILVIVVGTVWFLKRRSATAPAQVSSPGWLSRLTSRFKKSPATDQSEQNS